MNCIECQENLVAHLEGALDEPAFLQCQQHLDACPACRTEREAIARLQERLAARGRAAARVSLVGRVMSQIHETEHERTMTMQKITKLLRWGLGFGAATAGIVVMAVLLLSPKSQAVAAEVMAKGVQAARRLAGIHIQGRVRSSPAENFLHVSPQSDFTTVELWKEFTGLSRWRIEKPGRVVVMDGQATIHFLRPSKMALTVPPVPAASLPTPEGWAPFDTGWLHLMADVAQTLDTELRLAKVHGWEMQLTHETDAAGAAKSVVTIEAKSGLADGDYLKNKFFSTADTRRIYRFDDQTGRLEAVQVYLHEKGGDALIFEVDRIEYNPPLEAAVFQLELPPDVVWYQEPPRLSDNEKYAALTPEQSARAFFEACAKEDWAEAAKFCGYLDDRMKQYLGGVKLVSLGESFTSAAYPGRFVPYEIQLRNGGVKKHNLALKRSKSAQRWHVDGGL